MPKYPKNYRDIEYYVSGSKRRVAGSTKAVSDFLMLMHEENPTFTIRQLRKLITDKAKFIVDFEAVEVLDAHIKAGYGDLIPSWK